MIVLVINSWNYSIKYQLFDWQQQRVLARGLVERVGLGDSQLTHQTPGHPPVCRVTDYCDHEEAIRDILRVMTKGDGAAIPSLTAITAVGQRVVHGGERFNRSVLIDAEVLEGIREARELAPLHNEPNIAGIEAAMSLLPGIPHVAIFDTAFHRTIPERAFMYPLPYEWYEKHRIRRYGFHGSSHLYVAKRAAVMLGKPADQCNLVTLHIGNGASVCAIRNGISIDTSMGLTPLEGTMMGTRCGDIDPGIIPFMMQEAKLTPVHLEGVLNHKSGVLGITGSHSDRRTVYGEAAHGDHRCRLALDMEGYRLRKYIGGYIAAVGPLDAVVFTAGVGEMGWPLRELALAGMECFGIELDRERNIQATGAREEIISSDGAAVKALVIPTDEARVFVEDTVSVVSGAYTDHVTFPYTFARADYVRGG